MKPLEDYTDLELIDELRRRKLEDLANQQQDTKIQEETNQLNIKWEKTEAFNDKA